MDNTFSESLLQWYDQHGRKNLPWQNPKDAYLVWISEIMLQQTQVQTVIPFFERFIHRFPHIEALASASLEEVLAYWSGLGYYSRARNLHKAAKLIMETYDGNFPSSLETLVRLPGIGASTAAAICSLAFGQATPILDANVKRVLARYFLVAGLPNQSQCLKKLWELAAFCMPKERCADYTQAIMDLGATCCTSKNPNCPQCPLEGPCLARQKEQIAHYPFKTPKKTRPLQQQQFLFLYFKDIEGLKFYLEKRPSEGIWGGLWALPAIAWDSCPETFVQESFHLSIKKTLALAAFKHSFTHFHLELKAEALELDLLAPPNFGQGSWFRYEQCESIGLPKPMRKIIDIWHKSLAFRA